MNADRANFYAQYRSLITVYGSEVGLRAAQGYVLIEVIPASEFQKTSLRRTQPQQNGCYQPDIYEEAVGGVVQTPLFLMGKLEGTELDEVRQRLEILEADKSEKQQTIDKLTQEEKRYVKEFATCRELLVRTQDDSAVNTSALAQANTSLRKLEGDLARVRKHVGEKTFDEALMKP